MKKSPGVLPPASVPLGRPPFAGHAPCQVGPSAASRPEPMHNPGLTDLPTRFDDPRFHNFLTPIAEDDIMHIDSSADMIGDDFNRLTNL